MKTGKFAVLGGDRRFGALTRLLREDGYSVAAWAVDGMESVEPEAALRGADWVVLPMPAFDGAGRLASSAERTLRAEQLAARLRPRMRVFGGRLGAQTALLASSGAELVDYSTWEQLTAANAVPTAEGAIQIAMERLPVTIQGCRALVIGWGRIGKVLARKLALLGAEVTVSVRQERDRAMLPALGLRAETTGTFPGGLGGYDLVVNTVPSRVLGREQLALLPAESLIVDLASKPGGVDWDAAQELGREAVQALSLPGRVAPVSAGRLLRDAILGHLELH